MYALHDNLDRLRAERLLDAAQAASVPHLTEKGRTSFYRSAQKRAARRVVADSATTGGGPAPFFVNGTPVGKDGLISWLASAFGEPTFGAPRHKPRLRGASRHEQRGPSADAASPRHNGHVPAPRRAS